MLIRITFSKEAMELFSVKRRNGLHEMPPAGCDTRIVTRAVHDMTAESGIHVEVRDVYVRPGSTM